MIWLKKMFLMSSSVVALSLATMPLISCSTVNSLDENLADQLESLTSDEAKEVYLNFWARDAYATLYLKSKTPDADVSSNDFQTNKEIIKKYLLNLTPISSDILINGVSGDKISDEISSHLFNAYDFYTSWKTSNDINYFRDQKQIWVEKQLSLDEIDQTIEMDFQPRFAYSSLTTPTEEFKSDFNLLYKIIQTGIQTQLLNMTIAEFYFTKATSDMIQRGTNYNEIIDGNINSLDYWDAKSFNIDSPTYFLEKYLVKKTPKIKWNFSSEDAGKIENWTNRKIQSTQDYIDLWAGEQVGTTSSPKRIFAPVLLVNSIDQELNINAINFYGYNSSIELSATSGEGDLSTDADIIRTFGTQSSGLFNFETNQFVSFDTLLKRQKIENIKDETFLPKISILNNTNTTRKNSKQILASDLIIGDTNEKFDNGIYSEGKNTWKLIDIIPMLNSTTQQSIKLMMTYSNSDDVDGFIDYPYNVIITWNQTNNPSEANIVSELSERLNFNDINQNSPFGKQHIYGVNPIVESKVNVSYYIRLLPNFKWDLDANGVKNVVEIDGKEKAIGEFTMKETPWDNVDNQRTLAFSLYLNDDEELLKEIKSFLVLNDVAIKPGPIKEVNDILKELGIIYLDKKPDYANPRLNNERK